MCGIVAIFNYRTGEAIDRDELNRIRDYMSRRGPDGFGDWFSKDGRVGLGHRRLSIIDLSSTGAQPMCSADGKLTVTFNGEIYNYRELRAELEQKGCRFRSSSDTEVLLQLYAAEGPFMVNKLRGMYALAIWDETRQGLFLARDPFGIKPLYYADDGKSIRVASQVKALLAGGHIITSPEPAGHVGYFLWGHVPSPYTLYREIRSLPAGTSLWIENSGTRREQIFCSVTQILAEAEAVADEDQVKEQNLHFALRDSVQHHLIADVPVGVFLSSGLDSATLTALASETCADLRTVTLAFKDYHGKPEDESPLAEKIANLYGARHQTVWVSKMDFRENFDRMMQAMDQPSSDGINTFFVSLAATRAGLKVALSGVGGDELFGGYPSFVEIPRVVRVLSSLRSAPSLGREFRLLSAPLLRRFTSPKYAGLFEYGNTWGGAYLLRRGMFMPWELPDLLDLELVRKGWADLQPLIRLNDLAAAVKSARLKVGALELTSYMRNQLLCDTDWASMNHSIEVRTPFVDIQVLRQVSRLLASPAPPTKHDMALSPRFRLPESILNRPKTGFTIPVRTWLMEESLRPLNERGLRGWTRLAHSLYCGNQGNNFHPVRPAVRQRHPTRTKTVGEIPNNILIFRIGQLGDTVVALPSMWAIRRHFPQARLTLLCDQHHGKNFVLGTALLRGSGLFEDFMFYPVGSGTFGRISQGKELLSLIKRLRSRRFDVLVYLAPSPRSHHQVKRDLLFFRLAGIRRYIGASGFSSLPFRGHNKPLPQVPHESDVLLSRLAASGIPCPQPVHGCMELNLGMADEAELSRWLERFTGNEDKLWVGFAPGSKMPAKKWPLKNFAAVGKSLISDFDIWPIIFGGAEDSQDASLLLREWGRGSNAAGQLSIRGAAAALKRCILHIGNDTGTMHLAAAVGTKCIAIFSARDWPGRWYPYGTGHSVLRTQLDCEGCGLPRCLKRESECLVRITVADVLQACELTLRPELEALSC
jgi:asparagine synthase (glutamine-hydrolysing)